MRMGCRRFRPSSWKPRALSISPQSLKAKRSPGPKVLQRKSGTRVPGSSCRPALRPSRNQRGRLAGSRDRNVDYNSRRGRAPRLCARPLREDGRGTAWTTTPRGRAPRLCARPLERGLGGAAASGLLRRLWRGVRLATWTTRGRREAVQLMAEAEKRVKASHSFLRGLGERRTACPGEGFRPCPAAPRAPFPGAL